MKGLIIFCVILVFAFMIGSYIMTACFFGVLTLVGTIALVESIKPLKWLLSRSSRFFDVMIFVFTILATMNYGLNIAASLTIAGLGYTLFYGPYLREQRIVLRYEKKRSPIGNYKSKFNAK